MNPNSSIEDNFRLTTPQKKALNKLGLLTIRDLLYHFPQRYIETPQIKYIRDLEAGDHAIIYGKVSKILATKAFRKKIPMTKAVIEDASGKIRLVWFHQPYIKNMISEGSLIQITGKVGNDKQGLYIANPDTTQNASIPVYAKRSLLSRSSDQEKPSKLSSEKSLHPTILNVVLNAETEVKTVSEKDKSLTLELDTLSILMPLYPESKGITSRWFYYTLKKSFPIADTRFTY